MINYLKPRICKYNCIHTCDPKTTKLYIAQAQLEAYKGNLMDGFAFAGSNAARITRVSTVNGGFEEIKREYINMVVSGKDWSDKEVDRICKQSMAILI